jgi:hypothetical protein
MCNNRCVFCVSGQRTAMREAFPIAAEPVLAKLREARAQGIDQGHPPRRRAHAPARVHGRAARRGGARLQGDRALHQRREDRPRQPSSRRCSTPAATSPGASPSRAPPSSPTSGPPRSSAPSAASRRPSPTSTAGAARHRQHVRGPLELRVRPAFPALLLPYGVRQVHLDMMRPSTPASAPTTSSATRIPRYSDMVPALTAMIEGFEAAAPGFDVNVGNLPYCIAPALAPWIHHDGETTFTVSVNQRYSLSAPRTNTASKRRDKVKPTRCAECVFDGQCSGVFDTYERFYGLDELRPSPATTSSASTRGSASSPSTRAPWSTPPSAGPRPLPSPARRPSPTRATASSSSASTAPTGLTRASSFAAAAPVRVAWRPPTAGRSTSSRPTTARPR